MVSKDDMRFLSECHGPINPMQQAAILAGDHEKPDDIVAVDAVHRIAYSLQPDAAEGFAESYFLSASNEERRELLAITVGFCEGYLTLMIEQSREELLEADHIKKSEANGVTSIFAGKRLGADPVIDNPEAVFYERRDLERSIRMMEILQKIRAQFQIPKPEIPEEADAPAASPYE